LNVVSEAADEPSEDVVVSEATVSVEEEAPVASEVEEVPVASETEEAPVVEEAPVASEVEEAPVASEVEEAPVASEVEEAPVASETEETPVVSETEEASVEPEVAPIEQVVSDIRDILSEEPVASAIANEGSGAEVGESTVTHDNLCSLKTLVNVLGKWSGGEIKRRQVEELLKEGSEVDENLDDLEKFVEVLQLWIREGGSTFGDHNHFKNLDEYTLVGESRDLSEEKKVEVLKTLTELVVTVLQRKVTTEEIQNVMDTLY